MRGRTAKSAPVAAASGPGFLRRMGAILNRAAANVSYRFHVAAANVWRDGYNPLRSLNIMRVVRLLEEGERGAMSDLQWTYRFVEMQDATLGALIERRTSAIQELDWNIVIREDTPPEKQEIAKKQKALLTTTYQGIRNLSAAFEHLALASFRGFSRLEKITDTNGRLIELAKVEQWFWVRGGLYGAWQYNPDCTFGVITGQPVDESRFICREVDRPINRVALVSFTRKGLSQKDWDAFIETYGIDPIFFIMPEDVPEEKEEEYLRAADEVASNARGALPHGTDVKTVNSGGRGVNPFRQHIDYQDEQVVLRGTGGQLTMLTQSGSGTLAGTAHAATFKAIARAEAAEISEILREQIDADVLATGTPGEEAWARFELAANEEQDTKQIVQDAALLNRSGYPVDVAFLTEKTGYKFTVSVPQAPSSAAGAGVLNRILNRLVDAPGSAAVKVKPWKKFAKETGTLGIPRSVMPQIKSENRGAMVNFLKARGIDHTKGTAKPADLKPTQAEYSPLKVQASRNYQGTQRAILISSDNHVVDGHHQYMAALQDAPNSPIPVFRINAPIMAVIGLILQMASTAQDAITNRLFSAENGDTFRDFIRAARGDEEADAPAMRKLQEAMSADLQPLGKALESALQAKDLPALQAALKAISARMPEFLQSAHLADALGPELAAALIGGLSNPSDSQA